MGVSASGLVSSTHGIRVETADGFALLELQGAATKGTAASSRLKVASFDLVFMAFTNTSLLRPARSSDTAELIGQWAMRGAFLDAEGSARRSVNSGWSVKGGASR